MRGQLVLLAAVALALALVPMTLAYLQLGYDDDVGATAVGDAPVREAQRALDYSLQRAVTDVPRDFPWSDRSDAVTTVKARMETDIATLEESKIEAGTVFEVTYNDSKATDWSATNCPNGRDRQFGPCETDGGVVVQERVGETHVVAVAFDVVAITPDGRWRSVLVVRVAR